MKRPIYKRQDRACPNIVKPALNSVRNLNTSKQVSRETLYCARYSSSHS